MNTYTISHENVMMSLKKLTGTVSVGFKPLNSLSITMVDPIFDNQDIKIKSFGITYNSKSHLQLIGSYSVQDVRGLNSHSVFSNFLECLKTQNPASAGF